jgi:Type I phosphodiesterase / nucleotide pyrophosphatase
VSSRTIEQPEGSMVTEAEPFSRSNGRKIAVFVLIDALGWHYLQGRKFLDNLLPYRYPLQTILGFSSGAIPTILTGTLPFVHGHWNLFYYDPKNSPFKWVRHFRFLPDCLLDNRVSRKVIKEVGKRFLGLGPLFECCVSPRLLPFFNWVEKRNIYDRQGITGAPSIFDQLSECGISNRVYTYHHATDAQIVDQSEKDILNSDVSFFFVYLSEIDMFLHLHCKETDAIDTKIRQYEEKIRRLYVATKQADPDAAFSVLSDHGMTPVNHQYDLVADVEKLGLTMPDDYLAVYDSTMARFWFFNDQSRSAILRALRDVSCGYVLSREEMNRFGVLFEDSRYGEAIFLLNPGWLFSRSDFHGSAWFPSGMHGYHPEQDRYSDAIFLSNRRPESPLSTIKDVYRCMWQVVTETQ